MKIHFIGIGGIGISGIAFVLSKKGNKTQGSDAVGSEITKQLQEQGIDVFIGHKKEYITKNIDLVIYSEAIQKNNVELKQAKKLNIKCQTGAQALAELSKNYFTIAVSGMHGKTTTASMLAKILTDVGLDPTYIIGAKNSWRLGKSKYLIIEADDFQAKFLNYQPDILVLTNVEEEHMDYFKDLSHILKVFKQYISQVKQIIIANQNDKNIKKAIKSAKCPTRYYKPQNLELKAPGLHNQYNAAAALKTALALGIGEGSAKKSLRGFQGAWRRFEEKKIIVNKSSIIIISDYAHHPTEIAAVLKTAKEKYPKEKIWCIFQPHQRQRVYYLFNNFVSVFKTAAGEWLDKLIITDIYDVKGRESKTTKEKVSAQDLVKAINSKKVFYLEKKGIKNFLKDNLKGREVALIVGAGDIYDLAKELSTTGKLTK